MTGSIAPLRDRRPCPRTSATWRLLHHSSLLLLVLLPAAAGLAHRDAAAQFGPGEWTPLMLPQSDYARFAVHDPVHERMIMVCLEKLDESWSIPLADPSKMVRLNPTGPLPPYRNGPTLTYDPVRDRVILYGGFNNSALYGDVWELGLGSAPHWSQLQPTGTAPSPRAAHSVIYDPLRDRLIVFGGIVDEAPGYTNKIWGLELSDPPAWVYLPAAIPYPEIRYGHSAIYDPVRDRMLVFGGRPTTDKTVWELRLAPSLAWGNFTPTGSTPQSPLGIPNFYDAANDRVIYWDGGDSYYHFLALSPSMAWVYKSTTGNVGFYALDPVYDVSRNRLMLYDRGVLKAMPLSLNAWEDITPPNGRPEGRYRPSAVMDSAGDRIVMFGGSNKADTWTMSLMPAEWTKVDADPHPIRRTGAATAFDPVARRMYIYGGAGASQALNDTWMLDLSGAPTWTQLFPTGPSPGSGSGLTLVFDTIRRRLILYHNESPSFGVQALDVDAAPAWYQLATSGTAPPSRERASAMYDPLRDRMLIIGGSEYGTYKTDVYALSFSGTPTWAKLVIGGPPPTFLEPCTVAYDTQRDRAVILSGYLTFALHLDPLSWTQLLPTGVTPYTSGADAFYDAVRDWVVLPTRSGFAEAHALIWGTPVGVSDAAAPPEVPWLSAVRPNPASGTASIRCSIPTAAVMDLAVFDVLGRRIRTLREGTVEAGTHEVSWDLTETSGRRVGPGVYFARLTVAGRAFTRRIAVVD